MSGFEKVLGDIVYELRTMNPRKFKMPLWIDADLVIIPHKRLGYYDISVKDSRGHLTASGSCDYNTDDETLREAIRGVARNAYLKIGI